MVPGKPADLAAIGADSGVGVEVVTACQDGYPGIKVKSGWANVYDRLDPVAFDTKLANDFKETETLREIKKENEKILSKLFDI